MYICIRTYVQFLRYVCTYVPRYVHAYVSLLLCTFYVRINIFSEEDKSYKTMQYSIIVLGVLTCGTSVLMWLLFKGCCTSKEKYNVKGKYTNMYAYVRMYVATYVCIYV